jgi:hypothetical protein
MRPLLMIAITLSSFLQVFAQAPAAAGSAATKQDTANSPVPATEGWLTGWIDLGYRWRTDIGGSFDTYRSFLDLGSGPKLLGAEFTLEDPKHRPFDRIRVRANGWGGEPYETFHLNAEKSKVYQFSADYRDIAYFDYLPSYADPLLSRGIVLNEQSYDTHRKIGSFQLDLLPDNWIIPYFAYDYNAGSGTGATAFFTDANQFPVPNKLRDSTNLFRGGVRFERRRFHATLEEGGTTYKDDQSVFQYPGSTNYGNVPVPVLGQITDLTSLLAAHGIRGSSIYTKALFTADPAAWLSLYGQFLYTQPKSDVNYQQNVTGNLLLLNPTLFYTSQSYLLSAAAKLPHITGSYGAEMRPMRRLRVVASWLTDRLHNAGSATSNQLSVNSTTSEQAATLLNSALVNNYNQVEAQVFVDATSKLLLRGGYRYVWGDVSEAVLPPAGLVSADQAKFRRNVGLGGITFRPAQKLSLTAEAEVGSSGAVDFRTSLNDYQRVRAQARYQAVKSLALTADFSALLNNNPALGVNSDHRAQQESLSVFWTPAKIWNLQGSYTRSTVNSNIDYVGPGTLRPQTSLYPDNAHTATALFNVALPSRYGFAPKITAGGSFFVSSGSRPSRYYQPMATLWLPLRKNVKWFTEWRYYGYGEAFYLYEGFRAHLGDHGIEVDEMRARLAMLWVTAASLEAATIAADYTRGAHLFETLSYVQCHSINGAGGTIAPDLGRQVDRNFTPATLAATMWNHAPAMWAAMRQRNILPGDLDDQAAADLFAYFYSARFFEKPGEPRAARACSNRSAALSVTD